MDNYFADKPLVHQLPMREGRYLAQVIVPRNMTKEEADRLCAFVRSLASPERDQPAASERLSAQLAGTVK